MDRGAPRGRAGASEWAARRRRRPQPRAGGARGRGPSLCGVWRLMDGARAGGPAAAAGRQPCGGRGPAAGGRGSRGRAVRACRCCCQVLLVVHQVVGGARRGGAGPRSGPSNAAAATRHAMSKAGRGHARAARQHGRRPWHSVPACRRAALRCTGVRAAPHAQQLLFLGCCAGALSSTMPLCGCRGPASALGRRRAISVNSSFTLAAVLALVSRKYNPASPAYAVASSALTARAASRSALLPARAGRRGGGQRAVGSGPSLAHCRCGTGTHWPACAPPAPCPCPT
jgi:hypothetical protein